MKWHLSLCILLLSIPCFSQVEGPCFYQVKGVIRCETLSEIDSVDYAEIRLHQEHTALLNNSSALIPLKNYRALRQLNIITGDGFNASELTCAWQWYSETACITTSSRPDYAEITCIKDTLKHYDLVVLHLMPSAGQFTPQVLDLVNLLPQKGTLILVVYGSDTLLQRIENHEAIGAVILARSSAPRAMQVVINGIFGGIGFKGDDAGGHGFSTTKTRIHYGSSMAVGMDPKVFRGIDTIVADAIEQGAFPGCQVLAVWKGNVIFEKCYGTHTWHDSTPVMPDNLYDLASLTKVLATTVALIQLVDSGTIDIDKTLGTYLSMARGTNKENLLIKDILSHRARLIPWIPFYRALIYNGIPDTLVFSKHRSDTFCIRVAENLYIRKDYPDTVIKQILDSPLKRYHRYLYSDLGMILMKYMIEEQTKLAYEAYLKNNIYQKLNLYHTTFNPYLHFPSSCIIPTENDTVFRHSLLQGFVHDPAAAMLGGVSGHAGLFGNARDVAVIMQTLMDSGYYGGDHVFAPEVIALFNQRHFRNNRRGLGFDKAVLGSNVKRPNVTPLSSPSGFGHSGFTGTFAWADPEHQLVYVFLSNRVHPVSDNPLLTRLGVRMRIHAELYKVIRELETE